MWSAEALAELLGEGSAGSSGSFGGGSGGGGSSSSEVPLPAPTRRNDEADGRAKVDNYTAGGLFSWLGRDAA